ncbi:CoA-binding protein [Xenorhabdus budapestensis]|uniref:CoA-binding protein n=1 Tax=Xenorhabdus budapestensis TaxID=290110 RepID=A0A2D0J161_XENBU|nr:CoA-binding protein [Xenorhabdus budapestensis]PHM28057.1 CoA-binding protein [Xenorhabdus budapestensis]QTL41245.1 CoA-binding protein [Xenorhabdus budapestensis]
MSDQYIENILKKVKTIALVGASEKQERPSYKVMEYLLNQGYCVIPVSPKLVGKTLLGQMVVGQLSDIGQSVDMVEVFRNATAAYGVAEETITIGAKVLWLQKGVINDEAKLLAENKGLNVVMDRCPKIEIPRLGLEK